MILAAPICANAWRVEPYQSGDVNLDGYISIKDATEIQKYLAGMDYTASANVREIADTNQDGDVNIMDVTLIQKSLAGLAEIPNDAMPTQPTEPTTEMTTAEPTTAPQTQPPTVQPTTIQPTAAPVTQPATTAPAPNEPTAPNPKVKSNVTIYFTNNENWTTVNFYFFNSKTGEPKKAWPGDAITTAKTNGLGEKIFYTTVDTSVYDRVIFNNGTRQTVNVPVGKASSGFYISDASSRKAMKVGTYAYTGADTGTMKKLTLQYSAGYNKKIWIWTPADYSASSADKYRTVYMLDGQNMFDDDHSDSYGGWEVTDAVESMMSNGGRGVIVVGIDNGNSYRDSELTPDIGDVVPAYAKDFENGTGKKFSDFVVNTVMPYVQKNYNSSKAACDNCIAGSSSGGIEAFYIGIEHPDKFGQIGAFSPAFLLFGSSVWDSYLGTKTLSPTQRLYLYSGNASGLEAEIYTDAVAMYPRLKALGWDDSRIKLVEEETADHNEAWWRIFFPEMLAWCMDV